MIQRNKFAKNERLSSKKAIENLFKKGRSGFVFPLKHLYFVEKVQIGEVEILITIPKRSFKRAVHRNHLKRLIREAYRQQKHHLIEVALAQNLKLQIAFIFVHKEKTDFQQIFISVGKILDQISKQLTNLK
ncbi:MAG: ribonuclease P protein component [Bacteroidales bacterium]|nr:ribonuclease P protein component [Bacteroidales bacterium]